VDADDPKVEKRDLGGKRGRDGEWVVRHQEAKQGGKRPAPGKT